MALNNYKRKFTALFDKFFKENFELSVYYSENLIKYLENSLDKRAEKFIETPFFSDLIIFSLSNIENATYSVKTFIMEVLTIMLQNELQFSKFMQCHGFQTLKMSLFTEPSAKRMPLSFQIACMKCITATINHSTGIAYTIQTRTWLKVMTSQNMGPGKTISPRNGCYDYMAKYVWKLEEYDENAALIEVLTYVTDPIKNNKYLQTNVLDADEEKSVCDSILPSLHILLRIVSDHDKILRRNKIIPLLSSYLLIEGPIALLMGVTRNEEMVTLLAELNFRCSFAAIMLRYLENKNETDVAHEASIALYNILNIILHKRLNVSALNFSVSSFIFWSKLNKSIVPDTYQRYGKTFVASDQFLMTAIIPIIIFSYRTYISNPLLNEAINAMYYKLSGKASEHLVKAIYTFRELLESVTAKKTIIENCRQLFKMIRYLNEAQAGIVYQCLFYTLQRYVVSDEMGSLTVREKHMSCPDDIKLLSLVMESINMLLKEHNINWYENVEVISLQNLLVNLLMQNALPQKVFLQTMDLVDLSIKKFLSPDLALLVESRQGSTLNQIVACAKICVQNEHWEVRDSAFQLLLSCTQLAYVKYVPMQKLLNESNLMGLTVNAALCDCEMYVQTTALRCLAAACRIERLWRQATDEHPSIHSQLINALKNHPEDLVRKEAANVLLEIYSYKKLPLDFTKHLFDIMAVAALNDPHWEVQLVALHFWKKAIENQLSNRGMIDGKFPSVTFCKERRKIIVLNEREIENQINRILIELADIGCLAVLHTCLNDEFNTQVMEQTYLIAKELVSLLDYYKYDSVPEKFINYRDSDDHPPDCEHNDVTNVPLASEFVRNQVIEVIVNTNQCDLINELYKRHEDVKKELMEDVPEIKKTKWIDPNEFLNSFRLTDHLTIIEEKKSFNCGAKTLDGLLDEILLLEEVKTDIVRECI